MIQIPPSDTQVASSLLIRQGTLVDHKQTQVADILIKEGKICQIAEQIEPDGHTRVIEAHGFLIMPGGIDVHTHFNIDVGIARSCDDFYTGTRSAVCGGTTTIVDHMGFGPKGCNLHHQLAVYKEHAEKSAVIDYSFHGVIQHIDDEILAEIPSMVDEGITSFKLYMTYNYKLDDRAILQALTQLNRCNALTTVHPENDAAIALRREELIKQGKTSARYHAVSRPLECEAEAISRMINLATLADNAPLYIVHLSNGLGLEYCKLARKENKPLWVETCPQYLLLDESAYERDDAVKYVLSPPLRNKEECDKLWQGLADGDIDTIATDHCSFSYHSQKLIGVSDFTRCPNGIPGVETRMPLIFSEGVSKQRISLNQFVYLTSYKPAKLFGLYPQKGCLNIGSDADLVVFAPRRKVSVQHEQLHDNCDYTPYEGIEVEGWPVMTMSRGEIVAENGVFKGEAGRGNFIRRARFDQSEIEQE
ncbi:dihydropyrimidinase [Vibrio sp. SCSIO 43137]|uniref:dihydropyrimidinase n=1 Tax=Vibrio sp. SCSIO 43137 TaxID=3021011 RepID=UPI002307C521|nr:dihydropyrimidinase [Vibrio sp. SCSIO 43137]WCE31698.1 dihydropyrimidinase [Vibrio sp. SCSIO 43137]